MEKRAVYVQPASSRAGDTDLQRSVVTLAHLTPATVVRAVQALLYHACTAVLHEEDGARLGAGWGPTRSTAASLT